MKFLNLSILVALAASPSPHHEPTQPKQVELHESGIGTYSQTNYIDELCGDIERKQQQSCEAICKNSESSYRFEGGFCGIGSECTCK